MLQSAAQFLGARAGESSRRRQRRFLKWAGGKRQLLPELRQFVPATLYRLYRGVSRQRRVVLRPRGGGAPDSVPVSLIDSNADLDRDLPGAGPRAGEGHRSTHALAREHADPGSEHYYKVRGDQFNHGAARAARARGRRPPIRPELAARVSLPQSHVLQWAVPAERARRLQRAGRPLHESADLRRAQPDARRGAPAVSRTSSSSATRSSGFARPPSPASSSTSIRRTRRSVATAQFRSYTAEGFCRPGPGAAAATGDRAGAARLLGAPQQLGRAADHVALRAQHRCPAGGPAGPSRPRPPRDQSQRRRRGPVEEYLIS